VESTGGSSQRGKGSIDQSKSGFSRIKQVSEEARGKKKGCTLKEKEELLRKIKSSDGTRSSEIKRASVTKKNEGCQKLESRWTGGGGPKGPWERGRGGETRLITNQPLEEKGGRETGTDEHTPLRVRYASGKSAGQKRDSGAR